MGTKNKQYSAEFKQDAINYYYTSGKSIKQAAEDLKVSPSGLNDWIQNAKKNDGYDATPAGNFIRSYSRKGNAWDNAVIESFHALIKREWLNRFAIRNINYAHELVFEYIEEFHNTTRIHSHCNMASPHDFEKINAG